MFWEDSKFVRCLEARVKVLPRAVLQIQKEKIRSGTYVGCIA